MAPNALWLVESLTEVMHITPETKVLDLGCGRAMTSMCVPQIDKEHHWLPTLAPHLPFPIPAPLARGEPGCGFRGRD